MSEHDRTTKGAAPDERDSDPREGRLRALLATAHPWVEPPERLRRRVTERVARQEAQAARCGEWWQWMSIRRRSATGVLATALLLAVLGLILVQMEQGRSSGQHTLSTVKTPPPERPTPRSVPPLPLNDPGRRIVTR